MDRLETIALLRRYNTQFEEEQAFLAQTLDFVTRNAHFWQRSTLEGHLTGSAWVLSEYGSAALLLHHAKLDRWLQPGGHADEADHSLVETAKREALEECGMQDLKLVSAEIFDIDVHLIPARGAEPAHFHYDLRFLFSVPESVEIARNLLETKAIAWIPIHQLCTEFTPQSLRRMALKSGKVKRDEERF